MRSRTGRRSDATSFVAAKRSFAYLVQIEEKCKNCGRRALSVSFWGNLALIVFKATVGIVGGSKGLLADALHSTSDTVLSLAAISTTSVSAKESDEKHPFGHQKIEFITAAVIGIFLFAVAAIIFTTSLKFILRGGPPHPPKLLTLYTAVFAAITSYLMGSYALCAGKKVSSAVLVANAAENKADSLSSVGVAVGIALSLLGFRIGDPLMALCVSLFIFRTAFHTFYDAVNGLIDTSPDEYLIKKVVATVGAIREVKEINYLRTRLMGRGVEVDVELQVDDNITVQRGTEISEKVKNSIKKEIKEFFGDIIVTLKPKK